MTISNPIGWCDATTNAVTGCSKVSPGCANCYAEVGIAARVLRGQGRETWGTNGERVPVNFAPVFRRLNQLCVCDQCGVAAGYEFVGGECIYVGPDRIGTCPGKFRRVRLFADSNSDYMDPRWSGETLATFFDQIRLAPNVDTILLTKRIEQWKPRLELLWDHYQCREVNDQAATEWLGRWLDGEPPNHVCLGVSVEDQKRADERIPLLLNTPAAVRFLSVEPLLEAVNLRLDDAWMQFSSGRSWVIVGGESGKNRRDCGAAAIEDIANQCLAANVPCYIKQDCHLLPGQQGRLSPTAWSIKQFPL